MKFTEFLKILQQKKIPKKDCFDFDSIIISEADAFEFFEDKNLIKIADKIIIVDSDYLLSANIEGANKYQKLCELTNAHNIKHLKLANSGTLPHAVLNSKLLKTSDLNVSYSCKVVAPYFESGFAILPFDSRFSNIDALLQGILIIPENLQIFELEIDDIKRSSKIPENLAFAIIKKLRKILKDADSDELKVLLWNSQDYEFLPAHLRTRIFGLLNSIHCLSFQGDKDFDIKNAEEIFKQVNFNKLQVHKPKYEFMLDDEEQIINKISEPVSLDRVYLGGCTAGDLASIEEIADFVKGKKIRKNIEVILTPADFETYQQAANLEFLAEISKSGIIITIPSCATCKGRHTGVLADGEVALSSFPLGEKGRHGSEFSRVFRASLRSTLEYLCKN